MNCSEVRELLPAYVLGALEAGETDELEAHLRSGREHDDELVELRATVFALDRFADAESLDEPAHPTELRPTGARPRAVAGPRPIGAIMSSPRLRHAVAVLRMQPDRLALAAAAAIAIFAAGWFIANGTGSGTQHDVSLAIQGPAGQTLSLTGKTSHERVAVTMTGFERLPPDHVYQLWAIRSDTWVRIGLCNPKPDGSWMGEFPFAIRPGERIAVTVEPAGGSENPSSAPLLISTS